MMISFSLPGLPSPFSLRMPFASCVSELLAIERVGTAALNPKAEITEAKRSVNILRVEVRFIDRSFPFGLRKSLSRQCKAEYITPRCDSNILFSCDRIRHRRRAYILSGVEVPQWLARHGIDGFKRAGIVAEKHQPSRRGQSPSRRAASCLRVLPGNRSTIQVVCDQKLLRGLARNALHSG